jgi:hypothetical protein
LSLGEISLSIVFTDGSGVGRVRYFPKIAPFAWNCSSNLETGPWRRGRNPTCFSNWKLLVLGEF